jgi:hypothetical protein
MSLGILLRSPRMYAALHCGRKRIRSQLVKVHTEASRLYSRLEFSKKGGCDLSKALVKWIRCEIPSA